MLRLLILGHGGTMDRNPSKAHLTLGSNTELFCIIIAFKYPVETCDTTFSCVTSHKVDTSCINWAGLEGLKKWDLTGIELEGVFLEQEDTNMLYRSWRLWEEMEDLKDANFFVELARDNSVVYSPTIASAGGKIHIRSKLGKIIYSYNSIQSSERETAGLFKTHSWVSLRHKNGTGCICQIREAEGLCSQLNRRGHVDTCITSDSDAFLFGAKCTIKSIKPNSHEPFECYEMSDIKDGLGVKRRHMIAIALLVGNDHDLKGVQGIGLETTLSYVK
ncbi:flap endonuclease GEN-like 1 protein [Tanacetum coccineum]